MQHPGQGNRGVAVEFVLPNGRSYTPPRPDNQHRQPGRRRRRRNDLAATYPDLIARLRPADRRRINEVVITAVIALTTADGEGPMGTKAFLESRGRQLILDAQKVGWGKAAKRFRDAVATWAKNHPVTEPAPSIPRSVDSREISQ